METPVDPARLARISWEEPVPAPWFADRVREALDVLTPKQRDVVERYVLLGQTERQIAADLGIAQQVVHKRLHGVVRDGRPIGGALRRLRAPLLPLARMIGVVRP